MAGAAGVHDPGKIVADLAAALAGQDAPGGDGGLVTIDLDATIVRVGEGAGLSYLEEDLRASSADSLG